MNTFLKMMIKKNRNKNLNQNHRIVKKEMIKKPKKAKRKIKSQKRNL